MSATFDRSYPASYCDLADSIRIQSDLGRVSDGGVEAVIVRSAEPRSLRSKFWTSCTL